MPIGDYNKTVYTENTDVTPVVLNNNENKTKELDTALAAHQADYVRQPGYGTTSGSANAYALTLNPAPTSYTAGMGIVVKVNAANTGASTINVNELGAKSILDSKGNALTSGKLKLNLVYTLRYDGTNFILQGEGGDVSKLLNVIKNGNFASVDFWAGATANISVSSNELTVTPTAQYGGVYQNLSNYAVYKSHKLYFCADVYVPSLNIPLLINDGTAEGYAHPSVINTWHRISGVINVSSSATVVRLKLEDHRASGWTASKIKNCMIIDLTDMFGAGKEPDKATIDALIQELGGWWDNPSIFNLVEGNTTLFSSIGQQATGSLTPFKAKWITFHVSGTIRISFNLRSINLGTPVYGRIYRNGAIAGILRSTDQTTWSTFTEDFTVNIGDTLELFMWTTNGSFSVLVADFYIKNNGDTIANIYSS